MPANSGIEIASINVNGIRAAFRNGMGDWLKTSNSHILALQEVRASYQDLAEQFEANGGLAESGGKWHILHDEASAKGRAGVALVSTIPFVSSSVKLGPTDFDSAGRWLEGTYQVASKKLTVVSTYVHAGEAGTPKQIEKYKFLDAMQSRMAKLQKSEDYAVVVGDLNVGHTELDIKNWKGNLKTLAFFRRSVPILTLCWTSTVGWMLEEQLTLMCQALIPGGHLEVRPLIPTPVGESITTWPVRNWQRVRITTRSTVPKAMTRVGATILQ